MSVLGADLLYLWERRLPLGCARAGWATFGAFLMAVYSRARSRTIELADGRGHSGRAASVTLFIWP